MVDSIPVLWPTDIKVEVATPIAILKAQAEPLRRMSGGLLEVRLSTSAGGDFVRHNFDVAAPALNGQSIRLLSVTHQIDLPYPAKVESHVASPKWEVEPRSGGIPSLGLNVSEEVMRAFVGHGGTPWHPNAMTEEEFVTEVGKILRSEAVRALIDSLIARSNAQAESTEHDETGSTENA